MKKILTVAGSDSCGGAGIQADLKAITLLGAHGLSVITALTAQNTQGVFGVHPVPVEFIAAQWDAVCADISIDAVKTGMLWNAQVISTVAEKTRRSKIPIRVFDPVMVSKSGAALLSKDGCAALVRELLPLCTIVTPNIPEARILSGCAIRTTQDMERAARRIHRLGAGCVLIKGGHRRGAAIDVLYDGSKMYQLATPRIATAHTHGTGCTLASAIAVELTRSDTLLDAVTKAKEFVAKAIAQAVPLGKGQGPLNPYPSLGRDAELYRVVKALQRAFQKLQAHKAGSLIPEVQSNLGFALPEAHDVEDVVAFPGRIVRLGEDAVALAYPEPGASHHVARIILTVMSVNPQYRAAMNIRFAPEVLKKCRQQQWRIAKFDRRQEPEPVKQREGASLEWGIGAVLRRNSTIPDIIYDLGDLGKEPMIRVLGKTPEEVVNKVLCLR